MNTPTYIQLMSTSIGWDKCHKNKILIRDMQKEFIKKIHLYGHYQYTDNDNDNYYYTDEMYNNYGAQELIIYKLNNKIMSVDGPAVLVDRKICLLVRKNTLNGVNNNYCGKTHPNVYADNSGRRVEKYYQDGKLHNIHKPNIVIGDNGLRLETYYHHGVLHDVRKPSIVKKYVTESLTTVKESTWYINDQIHRDRGPAVIILHDDKPHRVEYYEHGLLHRDDGPAIMSNNEIKYYKHGVLTAI